MRQWNSAAWARSLRLQQPAGGRAFQRHGAGRQHRQPHRDGVLGEAHDAKAPFARNAFEAFAVVQRDHLQIAALRVGVRGALRQRDLEMPAPVALDEHPLQGAVGVGALRVDHGAAAAEHAESSGA